MGSKHTRGSIDRPTDCNTYRSGGAMLNHILTFGKATAKHPLSACLSNDQLSTGPHQAADFLQQKLLWEPPTLYTELHPAELWCWPQRQQSWGQTCPIWRVQIWVTVGTPGMHRGDIPIEHLRHACNTHLAISNHHRRFLSPSTVPQHMQLWYAQSHAAGHSYGTRNP